MCKDNAQCSQRAQDTMVQSSDGNFVNVGNFDQDGLNVNNDHRENSNHNLGVCPARKSHQLCRKKKAFLERPSSHLFAHRFYPAAEHSTDFLKIILADNVALFAENA